jgi:uncharacterized protein YhaN
VNLVRCHVFGFGKLTGFSAELHSGLNVIFAPNEGGKSTLQRCLISLLYGQLRSDLKNQRRLDPWVDRYKPWRTSDYGGTLWCRLANGRELEICRTFGKDEARIDIRTAAGENIAGQYEQQRNGDLIFARYHLGLPKELFESVAVIRENRVAELNGKESIRDRIANLAQSGDEDLSVRQSIEHLQEAMDSIGSERAPTRPYKQGLDLVQALQEEKKALDSRRVEFQCWVDERNRLAGDVVLQVSELARAKACTAAAQWREAAQKVRAMEEVEAELTAIRVESETLAADPSFPTQDLEALNQAAGACDSLDRRLAEIRSQSSEASALLRHAESRRREFAQYENLSASPEGEKITEWFVGYLSLSLQKDNSQKSINVLREEGSAAESDLDRLGPVLRFSEVDWERRAREVSEQERDSSQKSAHLAERIGQEKSSWLQLGKVRVRRRIQGAIGIAAALAPWAGRLFINPDLFPLILCLGLSLTGLVAAAFLFRAALRLRRRELQAEAGLEALAAEQAQVQQEGQRSRDQLQHAMTESGFGTVVEFLDATKRAESLRQRIGDLSKRQAKEEQDRCRVQAEVDQIYLQLKEALFKAGLMVSPGNLKVQIDTVRNNLRHFREADAYHRQCVQKVESLSAQAVQLGEEVACQHNRIEEILSGAGVDTMEAFREGCRKRQRMLELLEREGARKREFERLCAGRTLDEWRLQVRDLDERQRKTEEGDSFSEIPSAEETERAPRLPYLPSAAEAAREEDRVATQLAANREEHARLIERVNQAFHHYRPASEIEEDLVAAEETLRNLALNREALGFALETIVALSREQQEVLAPQLNRAVEQRLLRLCEGRYEEVKIDPDFQIWVREQATGELRSAEQLSRGTQDQIYFSLRFGILELVSNETEPCPCLLDEPFAAYDSARMVEAFEILRAESQNRQLFLFTCREDLLELGRRQGAHVLNLA